MYTRPLLFACLLATGIAQADLKATTDDGRKVLLKENGLWEFVDEAKDPEEIKALLQLELRETYHLSCRLGLRLSNNLGTPIRSLVLRFTAYKPGGFEFETVTRGYSRIKPTKHQYQQIRFRGLTCEEIDKVQVRAARNCHVGELTKYNASPEACLSLVRTEPSELMTIYQAPPAE